MDMESQVAEAVRLELLRQAEASDGALVASQLSGELQLSGRVDLEALAMAIVGAVAGGP
jgi:hypothetical protein